MARPPPKRVGALPQRTLQPASVSTLRAAFQKPDEVQVRLAGDTGLAPLISLLSHPHPKIRALSKTVVDSLIKHKTGDAEEEATLNEKAGWPALAELLSYDDNDARRGALLTLGTLANSEANARLTDRFIGVATLYERLSSPCLPVAGATAALLGSLAQHEALHETIMRHAELLVSPLSFSDNASRAALCAALGNLFLERANCAALVQHGAVKALTEQLASADPKVQEAAATAIAGIASDDARATVTPAAVERLGALAHAPQPNVRRAALAALATLASVEALHETLLRPGLIKLVTDVLLDPADTPVQAETQLHAARLLNALAANERAMSTLTNADAWAALSKHSANADPAVAREAQQALAEAAARGLGTDKMKNKLREAEAAKVRDAKEREQRAASERAASEAREAAAREALEAEKRVAKERELAKKEAELREAEAARAVETAEARRKLAVDEAAQRERLKKAEQETLAAREAALAAREAAMQAAERAAKESADAEARRLEAEARRLEAEREAAEKRSAAEKEAKQIASKEAALAAREAELAAREAQLAKSMSESAAKAAVSKSGSGSGKQLEPIAEGKEKEREVKEAVAELDGDDNTRARGLKRLEAAAKSEANLDTLRAGGALPKVLAQIEKRSDKVPWLDLLAGIARNEANREAIRELGGLEIVMRVVRGPPQPNERTLLAALRALHVLALNLRNASWLRDAGLLALVIPLVGQEATRLLALQMLHALILNNPATQIAFTNDKGYTPVLLVLAPESTAPADVRVAAVRVLAAMAENNERCATTLRKARGLEALMRQAESPDETLVVAALEAMQSYGSELAALYSDLRDARVAAAIARVLALRVMPLAQIAALHLLRKEARLLKSRVAKDMHDSLPLIADLLASPTDTVAAAALGAMFELARDSDALQELLSTPESAKHMMRRLADPDLDSQYWALGLIWLCASKKARREVWQKAGAVDYASALRNSPNETVRRGVSELLRLLEKKK